MRGFDAQASVLLLSHFVSRTKFELIVWWFIELSIRTSSFIVVALSLYEGVLVCVEFTFQFMACILVCYYDGLSVRSFFHTFNFSNKHSIKILRLRIWLGRCSHCLCLFPSNSVSWAVHWHPIVVKHLATLVIPSVGLRSPSVEIFQGWEMHLGPSWSCSFSSNKSDASRFCISTVDICCTSRLIQ